MENLSPGSNCM